MFVKAVGRLQIEQYDGDDGTKRVRAKIHDPALRAWPKRDGGDYQRTPEPQPQAPQPRAVTPAAAQAPADDDPFGDQ
jgi:single-stranded DNA-binding protein